MQCSNPRASQRADDLTVALKISPDSKPLSTKEPCMLPCKTKKQCTSQVTMPMIGDLYGASSPVHSPRQAMVMRST